MEWIKINFILLHLFLIAVVFAEGIIARITLIVLAILQLLAMIWVGDKENEKENK